MAAERRRCAGWILAGINQNAQNDSFGAIGHRAYQRKNKTQNPFGFLKNKIMWKEQNDQLYKKFEFKDFSEAFAFMTRVALAAEKMDHHPLWTNVYNIVEIWLSTHSAGDKVTEKDKKLADKIDGLV